MPPIPPLGSLSASVHAADPPVGFVEVRMSPRESAATQRATDGHEMPVGSPLSTLTAFQCGERENASVELMTHEPKSVNPTHSETDAHESDSTSGVA